MGGFFQWSKSGGDSAAPKVDEHASSPGAANTAPDASSVQSSTRAAAAENARKISRRGRPRTDAGNATVTDSELQGAINARIAEQLQSLHAPEMWEAMLCMPGDTMHAFTGKERWEFSAKERKTVGLSGSALAQTMMITNPRALAAFMFISIMGSAYIPRALAELKEIATKKKEEKKNADAAPKPNS